MDLSPFLMILKALGVIKVDPFNLGYRKSAGWLHYRLRNWEREDQEVAQHSEQKCKKESKAYDSLSGVF